MANPRFGWQRTQILSAAHILQRMQRNTSLFNTNDQELTRKRFIWHLNEGEATNITAGLPYLAIVNHRDEDEFNVHNNDSVYRRNSYWDFLTFVARADDQQTRWCAQLL